MTDTQRLIDLLGQWVTVTNPTNPIAWTGQLVGLADDPSLIIKGRDGHQVSLPQAFQVEAASPQPCGPAHDHQTCDSCDVLDPCPCCGLRYDAATGRYIPAVATPATADDGLREKYAAALVKVRWDGMGAYTEAEACQRYADAVLAVRDRRMEQLAAGRETWKSKAAEIEADRDRLDRTRPTTWAYQQASKALEKHRQRADDAEAKLAEVRRWAQAFGPTGVLDILDGKAGQ